MSLRDELIEAGARAAYEANVRRMQDIWAPKLMLLPSWDEIEDDEREHRIRASVVHFDAVVEGLAANAPSRDISDVIAALRPPVSSSRDTPGKGER